MAKAKNTAVMRAFFVAGSDEAGVKRRAQELAQELAPGADAFGLELIDGASDTVESAVGKIRETIGGILTMPFLAGSKVVWLKSASFLADSVVGRSEQVAQALEGLCEAIEAGMADGVKLLLSAPLADKRRSAFRRLSKICQTEIVDLPDLGFGGGEERIVEWVVSRARERGLHLGEGSAEVLASRVGLNAVQLDSELEKLETAYGRGVVISAREVRDLVPQTREGGIFDLSEAILRRDGHYALETLDQLMRQGEKGVGILLAAIVPTVRNLLLVKDLMVRCKISAPNFPGKFGAVLDRLPESETMHLPRKKDGTINAYPLGLAAMAASHYTLEELEEGFLACGKAAQALFSGVLDEDVVLARLILGLVGRSVA